MGWKEALEQGGRISRPAAAEVGVGVLMWFEVGWKGVVSYVLLALAAGWIVAAVKVYLSRAKEREDES